MLHDVLYNLPFLRHAPRKLIEVGSHAPCSRLSCMYLACPELKTVMIIITIIISSSIIIVTIIVVVISISIIIIIVIVTTIIIINVPCPSYCL